MVLKSRGYVLKKLFIVLYTVQCTLVHAYVHIKKLSLRAAVVANRSITALMLRMSDRWIVAS